MEDDNLDHNMTTQHKNNEFQFDIKWYHFHVPVSVYPLCQHIYLITTRIHVWRFEKNKNKMFTGKGAPITEINDEEKQTLINIFFVTLDNVIIILESKWR